MVTGLTHLTSHLAIVEQVWIEFHSGDSDACDVLVRMEDGNIYTAPFVTLAHLRRQMELTFEVTRSLEDTLPVRFATLDTPHVLVENLERDTIEDTIDNLIAMDTFESLFTRVTENASDTVTTTTGTRATQEVAAVVLSEVLKIQG